MSRLSCIFFPRPFVATWLAPLAVSLLTLFLAQAVLIFGLRQMIPDSASAAQVAYFIAHLAAFFAPLAFLLSCTRREPPLSLCSLVSVLLNYVLPVTLVQLLYAIPGGVAVSALLHCMYLVGLIAAVWGVESFLQSLGLQYDMRRLLLLLLLVVVVCDVILFNNVVERAKSSRQDVITVLLAANPAMMTAAAYGKDVLRGEMLYHRSVIGQFYYFQYPSPVKVFFILLIFAGLMGIASAAIRLLEGKLFNRPPPDSRMFDTLADQECSNRQPPLQPPNSDN